MSTSMSTSQRTSMRTTQRIQQLHWRVEHLLPIEITLMEVEGLLELLLCNTISPKNIPLFYSLLKYHIIHSPPKNSLIIRKHSSKKHFPCNYYQLKNRHYSQTFFKKDFRCNYYQLKNKAYFKFPLF